MVAGKQQMFTVLAAKGMQQLSGGWLCLFDASLSVVL
jgi:hypothetical protein